MNANYHLLFKKSFNSVVFVCLKEAMSRQGSEERKGKSVRVDWRARTEALRGLPPPQRKAEEGQLCNKVGDIDEALERVPRGWLNK